MYKAASLLFCYLAVVFYILKVVTAKHMSSLSFRYKYFIFSNSSVGFVLQHK